MPAQPRRPLRLGHRRKEGGTTANTELAIPRIGAASADSGSGQRGDTGAEQREGRHDPADDGNRDRIGQRRDRRDLLEQQDGGGNQRQRNGDLHARRHPQCPHADSVHWLRWASLYDPDDGRDRAERQPEPGRNHRGDDCGSLSRSVTQQLRSAAPHGADHGADQCSDHRDVQAGNADEMRDAGPVEQRPVGIGDRTLVAKDQCDQHAAVPIIPDLCDQTVAQPGAHAFDDGPRRPDHRLQPLRRCRVTCAHSHWRADCTPASRLRNRNRRGSSRRADDAGERRTSTTRPAAPVGRRHISRAECGPARQYQTRVVPRRTRTGFRARAAPASRR